ncbi:MAG TPA: PRC-barrel domain-containing protein [Planctomycetota bacterium]|nr:PRC-barrel domain-containing protein [Planctomycetota bacterium]
MSTLTHPRVISSKTLVGESVENPVGENLGTIQDIMIDVSSGRIAYAVLSFGGFLGFGSKLFALPWSALKVDISRNIFVLEVPRERLEKAPGFDKDAWPDMADAVWARGVHSYYGVAPYWERT